MSLFSKCYPLFTLHPPNCLHQHHQGKHSRRGGVGEESGAEDRELFPAGRGAPHRAGGHTFHCTQQTHTQALFSLTHLNKNTLHFACKHMYSLRQCDIHESVHPLSRWAHISSHRNYTGVVQICKNPHTVLHSAFNCSLNTLHDHLYNILVIS